MSRQSRNSSGAALMAAWLMIPALGGEPSMAERALMGRVEVPAALAMTATEQAAASGSLRPEEALQGQSVRPTAPSAASGAARKIAVGLEQVLLNR